MKEVYLSDKCICTLDITGNDTGELVRTGYIDRKLDSFFFLNQFTEKEINEFFYEECTELDLETLGPVTFDEDNPQIIDILRKTKSEAVKCFLWHELVNFVCILKHSHSNN